MNIKKVFIAVSFAYLSLFSFKSLALTAYIAQTSLIHFGFLIHIPGSCDMAYDTKLITNTSASNICTSSAGQLGKYRIYANPNTQVQIKVKSHNDNGSGIIYIPNGELGSDAETLLIVADVNKTIDSGASGIIDIHLGGSMYLNNMLSSSTNYIESFDIDFTELP